MKKFKFERLEERIAPSIITSVSSSTKFDKHPGPTDTQTVTTEVQSTNPAGKNPPGQPNYTSTTTTEVANRFAR